MNSALGTIYYDGLCRACSTEIHHYRKLKGAEKFQFVDITQSDFSAKREGVDPQLVHKVMHVRDGEGRLQQGVDAFRAIWKELPRYQLLYRASLRQPARLILEVFYQLFVRVRPYLPRKKSGCSTSPYCEVHHG